MATAAEEIRVNIRDQFLQCKICLDVLKEPKTLACLHTFCAECIVYYIDHNRIDSRKFACPICRRHIYIPKNGVDGFPDSFFVSSLTDIVHVSENRKEAPKQCGICKFKDSEKEANCSCVECKTELCEECAEAHKDAKITKSHTLLKLTQDGSSYRENYCRVHKGEPVTYYCETCNSPVCLPCTFLDHKGHDIEEIKKVRENFSDKIQDLVLQSQDNILQLEHTKVDLEEFENELFVRKETIKTDVRRTTQELYRNIQKQEAQLMIEIDKYYDTVTLGRDKQKLERANFRLKRAHEFVTQLLSTGTSPITQLVNRSEAKENLQQALEYKIPDVRVHEGKLDYYMYFLPGNANIHLGTLLRCTNKGHSNTVTELRSLLPSTKALFLHKLRQLEREPLLDVISMAFLPSGDLVVLVRSGRKIKVFGSKGKLKYDFGDDEELQHPSDITITREREIAVTDCGHLKVKVFDPFGSLRFHFGSDEIFALPISITTDNTSRFLICDQAKQQVTIHRPNGDLVHLIPITEIQHPHHIRCHSNRVFICDPENNSVTLYNYGNEEIQLVAKMVASDENPDVFLDCSGIAVSQHGDLLICDQKLDRVQLFNPQGEISGLLPSGRMFRRPKHIATSIGGMLAVCQIGVDRLEEGDTTETTQCDVCVYRLVRVDV